jgi:hypothetical protein
LGDGPTPAISTIPGESAASVCPRGIEEEWPELRKAKNLFPVLVVLKLENGPERLRFELKSIQPQQIDDRNGALF